VHRALFAKPGDQIGTQPLKVVCEHISDTERNSADAERDSKDVKLFAFLTAQLESGKLLPYTGLVTDVRNFGFFVDVSGLAMSGLVPLSTLTDDFFQYDSNRTELVGRRTRRIIKLGDRLEVQVAKVDRFKKQVDFRLAGLAKASDAKPSGFAGGSSNSRPRQQPFGRQQSQQRMKTSHAQGLRSARPGRFQKRRKPNPY